MYTVGGGDRVEHTAEWQHMQYMNRAHNCHRSVKAIAHENTIHTIVHNPATEISHHEPALARKLNVWY